jgi:hypothetical protein
MAQTTFEIDEATLEALEDLKEKFGVRSNANVIRKALALARVAMQNMNPDRTLVIVRPDGVHITVLLAG